MQRRILQLPDPDRDVDALFEQVDDPLVAAQLKRDLRIQRHKFLHVRHDAMKHERRCGIHAQSSRGPFTLARDHLFRIFHRGDDSAGARKEQFALVGQLQTAGGSMNQRGVELLFEPCERAADAGDGLLKQFRRRRDGAAIDHRYKGQQFVRR